MAFLPGFVSAMVSTALIVTLARFLLSFVRSEPANFIPALCVGAGFLIGRYSVSNSVADPNILVAISEFCGSVVCLVILYAGFRYQAIRMNVA